MDISIYPKKVTLRDGTVLTLRPGGGRRRPPAFLPRHTRIGTVVPEGRRHLPRTIQHWCENLDYKRALPVLAVGEDAASWPTPS
jgi:hypothetical protein